MHLNSLSAYADLPLQTREREALTALAALGGLATDREIALQMGSADPNKARPRITSLLQRGVLRSSGNRTDSITRKSVRLVELAH